MRRLLDKLEPNFKPGGKWESWYALFEAVDTALYKPAHVTKNSSHVRDGIDLKRVMITFGWPLSQLCFLVCGILAFRPIPSSLRWAWTVRRDCGVIYRPACRL